MPLLPVESGLPGKSPRILGDDIPIERRSPPIVPSDPASLQLNQSSAFSEDDIEKLSHVPKEAYVDAPGRQDVSSAWGDYLDVNNHRRAFQPLRGIERDRYRPIVQEATVKEAVRRGIAFQAMRIIEAGRPLINHFLATRRYPPLPEDDGSEELNSDESRNAASRPDSDESRESNTVPPSIREQCMRDMLALDEGYHKLGDYLERGSRHTKRQPEFFKAHYATQYGTLTACNILPGDDWYVGHRPGDPIVRIKENPIQRTFNEGDIFFVYELAGRGDGDQPERYRVRFEGVVPFNSEEIYQRFSRFVFPAFIQMVIAAVGFDPRDIKRGAHFWAKQLENLHTTEFEEFRERDRVKLLKALRKIWHAKYGTEAKNHPRFLKAQTLNSISCLREMGWLMSKLERDAPRYARHHYWNHCKGLLQDFTGRDAGLLAQEYFDITLANEAEYLLKEGDLEDVLVYKQSNAARTVGKVRVGFFSSFSASSAVEDNIWDLAFFHSIVIIRMSSFIYWEKSQSNRKSSRNHTG
ncbi:hypothetical protein O1611_g8656 [Lasiodiplodia mahajangana]|uniref:Uncharacterized protein n=1 Tax=Lasiodiplodia mahajangana TaxID=1108764 RepID=A0ACC2JBX6_9PEZI|nr:hypothetical protein O1611_g8656 [Lasiodiplodia mahajangana]